MKTNKEKLKKYEDIIHLPHHVSSKRTAMSLKDRAAQFAPFAAVVGHEASTREAARQTDKRKPLGDEEKSLIAEQLMDIASNLPSDFEIEIVYFEADKFKSGGSYLNKVGKIKRLNLYTRELLMLDETVISIDEIYSITKI